MIIFVIQHFPYSLLTHLARLAPLTLISNLCASPLAAAKKIINAPTIRS